MRKIKPILFSTPMVQAILEGEKMMTRRLKGLEEINANPQLWQIHHSVWKSTEGNMGVLFQIQSGKSENRCCLAKMPYIKGDILWVRETWNHWGATEYPFVYKATDLKSCGHTWKPSIHMPYEAARIFLKVTDVRVERLQDISEEDAIAEGVENYDDGYFKWYGKPPKGYAVASAKGAINSFYSLWISINGEQSWNDNPWVWVYTFEKTEKPKL